MKVDLTQQAKGLDGEDLPGLSLGQLLGSYLSETNKGDSIRMLSLAFELWKNKPVEIELDLLDEIKKLLASPDCEIKNIFGGQIRSQLLKAANKSE